MSETEGEIVGALASHVRRIEINGSPNRLACSGPLIVAPESRHLAIGAMLLARHLKGPQDLTITDGATEKVRAMWERLGGELMHPQSIEWIKPLRPGSMSAALLAAARGRERPGAISRAVGRIGDSASRFGPIRRALDRSDQGFCSELDASVRPLTADMLCSAIPVVASRRHLHPLYDPEFAAWLLAQLSDVSSRGELRARLVSPRSGGDPAGWFIYYLRPSGISPVISVVGVDEERAGLVLDALIADAREAGAPALRGRLEPDLVAGAGRHGCLLRYAGQALVHSRDPALMSLAASRYSLLTRLEGEWWMDPHLR